MVDALSGVSARVTTRQLRYDSLWYSLLSHAVRQVAPVLKQIRFSFSVLLFCFYIKGTTSRTARVYGPATVRAEAAAVRFL
jgi:hypothetical protein